MKRLFRNWDVLRVIRLLSGAVFAAYGIYASDSLMIVLGGLLMLMAMVNWSCCADYPERVPTLKPSTSIPACASCSTPAHSLTQWSMGTLQPSASTAPCRPLRTTSRPGSTRPPVKRPGMALAMFYPRNNLSISGYRQPG